MIKAFADWLIYVVCGLEESSRIGIALDFFVYDATKILILLFLISTLMGVINAYFPIDRLRNFLQSRKLYGLQYFLASVFGAITPFCSCSSIPLFIGFVKGGIPLGVTLSFLITSPLVNEVAVAMFVGAFGLKMTLVYVLTGIVMGTIGGTILGQFRLDRFLSLWVIQIQQQGIDETAKWERENTSFGKRLPRIIRDSWGIVKGVLLYVVAGIAIGAGMHGYVPEGFFESILSGNHWWEVPVAVVLAVPMYSNAAGIVPVMEVLVQKGVAMGTALSFMMAVVGLSLPEATMLKKAMTWKLIGIFFASVALFIIISGWLFNMVF